MLCQNNTNKCSLNGSHVEIDIGGMQEKKREYVKHQQEHGVGQGWQLINANGLVTHYVRPEIGPKCLPSWETHHNYHPLTDEAPGEILSTHFDISEGWSSA